MTTPRRTPAAGQEALTFGLLAERPGSQLDLIAEAGLETIGPSTVRLCAVLGCTDPRCDGECAAS